MQTVILKCDASALLQAIRSVSEGSFELGERPLSLRDLLPELVSLKVNNSAATASELTVRLEPSNAFLRLLATARTRDGHRRIVEESGH